MMLWLAVAAVVLGISGLLIVGRRRVRKLRIHDVRQLPVEHERYDGHGGPSVYGQGTGGF